MGLRVEDESCTGCGDNHVTVWLVIAGFNRWCAECYEHHTGAPPEDATGSPEVAA
jgi:hypothetical protein